MLNIPKTHNSKWEKLVKRSQMSKTTIQIEAVKKFDQEKSKIIITLTHFVSIDLTFRINAFK